MRRSLCRFLASVAVVALAASCGDDDVPDPAIVVATADGVAVLDGSTGELGAPAPAAVSDPSGEVLVRADAIGVTTSIRAVDVAQAHDRWSTSIRGRYEPRVVDLGARRVALVPPPANPRLETELVVVHDDGGVDTYRVDGNVDPEAFGADGGSLFVIAYVPPEAPTRYQIRRLDLATGELGPVRTPDAHLQDAMRGTAGTHVWAGDGSRLYTLYTESVGARTTAFVHVLDLQHEWAHCIVLPDGFSPSSGGLALDAGGDDLYAVDVATGIVAHVDADRLATVDSGAIPPVAGATSSPVAVVGDELVVGAGDELVRLDRSRLAPTATVPAGGDVVALQPSTRDDEVVVALPDRVVLLGLDEADERLRVPAQATGLVGRSVALYPEVECAC